jgi:erythromycin esterase-like protein
LVQQDLKVQLVQLEQPLLFKVLQVQQVLLDQLVRKVHQADLVRKVLQDQQAQLVQRAQQALRQPFLGQQVQRGQRDQLVQLEM